MSKQSDAAGAARTLEMDSPDPGGDAGQLVSTRRAKMTATNLALLLFAVISAGIGQVMLKHGMHVAADHVHQFGGSLVFRAATSPWVVGGLAVFAVSAFA